MKTLPKRYIFKFQNAAWAKAGRQCVIVIIGERENKFLEIIHSLYRTTPSGLDILDGLLAKRPLISIAKSLAKKYRISFQRAHADVSDFIEPLKKEKLFAYMP